MPRLLRFFVNGLCLLSLLACVGTAWLWWHCRKLYGDSVNAVVAGRQFTLFSSRGDGLQLTLSRGWPLPDPLFPLFNSYATEDDTQTFTVPVLRVLEEWRWRHLGFHRFWYAYEIEQTGSATSPSFRPNGPRLTVTISSVSAPHASVGLVTAFPPVLWLALRSRRLFILRRRRRRRLGLCRRCGYDLTGNTSGRCSECGEAVNAEATA